MTHLRRQKLILSTQVRGYNTQFLLYPRRSFICVMNDGPYTCYKTEVFLHLYLAKTDPRSSGMVSLQQFAVALLYVGLTYTSSTFLYYVVKNNT